MTLDDWLLNLRQAAPADRPALMLQLSDWLEENSVGGVYADWARRIGAGEWSPVASHVSDFGSSWHWFNADDERRCGYETAASRKGKIPTHSARVPMKLFNEIGKSPDMTDPMIPGKDGPDVLGITFLGESLASLAVMEAVITLAKESA